MRPYRNLLLSALSEADLNLVERFLEPVTLPLRSVQVRPNVDIDYVTFIEAGLGSIVAVDKGKISLEVALVGREGLIGTPVVLGQMQSPHQNFMQVGGHGFRIPSLSLRYAMDESPTLRGVLLGHVHNQMCQMAETALANGRFNIRARLARWLLMSMDRLDGESVPLTHEYLSFMLGVRRAGVSEAIAVLEAEGVLRAAKANIVITDREGLKVMASPIYTSKDTLVSS